MKRYLLKLSSLLLLISLSLFSIAQPNWYYTNTGANHSILIPSTIPITIDGINVVNGDYIGAFYDSLGTLACAGYIMHDGTATIALTIWGDDASAAGPQGFNAGEEIVWKIWRASDGAVFNAVAYFSNAFPSLGYYTYNGMSGLDSLIAATGPNLAMGNIISPILCGLLTATESFTFQVLNTGTVDVDSFDVLYSIDGGSTYFTETVIQFLAADSSFVFTSTQTFDLSSLGAYQLGVSVYNPNDNFTNDNTILLTIYNAQPPVIDLSGLTTLYCASSLAIPLVGIPANGVFTSTDIYINSNNEATISTQGIQEVFYTYTDTNGCSAVDSVDFTINPVPSFNLGSLIISCEGESEQVGAQAGFTTYAWNTGATDSAIFVTTSGIYTLTITNSFGCNSVDSVEAMFNPVPVFEIQGDTESCDGSTIYLSAAGAGNSYIWNTGNYNDSISVLTTGDYSVIVSENGCLGFDTVSVVFHPNPVVDLGSNFSFCEGTSAELDAGSFDNYVWSSDGSTNQTLIIIEAGTYVVTVSDANGCFGLGSVSATVDPLATADFSFIINNSEVSFTNESQNEIVGTYFWDFGDGETSIDENPEHTYSADDTYSVMLVVGNDCGNDTISMFVTILDIEDLSGENNISVFPNPSNGSFIVELQNLSSNNVKISVFNSLGQKVFLSNNSFENKTNFELNLTNNPSGIYFLSIENIGWVYSKMIVIE